MTLLATGCGNLLESKIVKWRPHTTIVGPTVGPTVGGLSTFSDRLDQRLAQQLVQPVGSLSTLPDCLTNRWSNRRNCVYTSRQLVQQLVQPVGPTMQIRQRPRLYAYVMNDVNEKLNSRCVYSVETKIYFLSENDSYSRTSVSELHC